MTFVTYSFNRDLKNISDRQQASGIAGVVKLLYENAY